MQFKKIFSLGGGSVAAHLPVLRHEALLGEEEQQHGGTLRGDGQLADEGHPRQQTHLTRPNLA